jgi:hypothetical protein
MKAMTVSNAMKFVFNTIGNNKKQNKTQDPDEINIHKQWSEFGSFKGYWIDVTYKGRKENLVISFDYTRDYVRTIGTISKIPKFTPGKHNFVG